MAFLKGAKDEITVQLTVEVDGDLGKKIRVPFKATYKKLKVQEARDVVEKCTNGSMTDEDVVEQYLVNWSELKGADDNEVEFNPDNVYTAMQVREYRSALVDGFMRVQFGRQSVNGKNS
jgi:hypothetical protein